MAFPLKGRQPVASPGAGLILLMVRAWPAAALAAGLALLFVHTAGTVAGGAA